MRPLAPRLVGGAGRSRRQALVEFAFILPLIVFLAFAFVDLGRAVFSYTTLTGAARTAARVAAVSQLDPASGPYECDASRPVEDPSNPHWTFRGCALLTGAGLGLQAEDLTITYNPPSGSSLICGPTINIGCIARVAVSHTWTPITPVAGALIGDIVMSSAAEQPVERTFP